MLATASAAPAQDLAPEPRHASPPEQSMHVLRVAQRAMAEMQRYGVVPTPRNYQLWYASLDGSNKELGRRLASLLALGTPAQPVLDALEGECSGGELDMDAVVDGSEAIQSAAQEALDGLAGN